MECGEQLSQSSIKSDGSDVVCKACKERQKKMLSSFEAWKDGKEAELQKVGS